MKVEVERAKPNSRRTICTLNFHNPHAITLDYDLLFLSIILIQIQHTDEISNKYIHMHTRYEHKKKLLSKSVLFIWYVLFLSKWT